jgi:hypothetical protein
MIDHDSCLRRAVAEGHLAASMLEGAIFHHQPTAPAIIQKLKADMFLAAGTGQFCNAAYVPGKGPKDLIP